MFLQRSAFFYNLDCYQYLNSQKFFFTCQSFLSTSLDFWISPIFSDSSKRAWLLGYLFLLLSRWDVITLPKVDCDGKTLSSALSKIFFFDLWIRLLWDLKLFLLEKTLLHIRQDSILNWVKKIKKYIRLIKNAFVVKTLPYIDESLNIKRIYLCDK